MKKTETKTVVTQKKKSVVKQCSCSHEYQDDKYGYGMRLHTIGFGENPKYKCTVCDKSK